MKKNFLLKKIVNFFFCLGFLLVIISCEKKNNETIPFDVFYQNDFKEIKTINSVVEKNWIPLKNPNLGFKNGVYWFKVEIQNNLIPDSLVFNLSKNSIYKINVYQNLKPISFKNLSRTNSSLLILPSKKSAVFYLKVTFKKQVYFDLQIKKYNIHQLEEHFSYFKNGIFYGLVMMVLIINIFFFFSLKDKSFLFYCFFLIIITLVIADYDGTLGIFFPLSFLTYVHLITHSLVSIFGILFANQFLNLEIIYPRSNKIGIFLLFVTICSYLLFFPTNKYLFVAIGNTLTLIILLYYWIIALFVLGKHEFAKFFVLGYSLVLFSSFMFILYIDWGIHLFRISLNTIKFSSLFEMLILTYAITYKVKILNEENKKIKKEIQKYLSKKPILERKTPEITKESLMQKHNLTTREVDVLLLISKGYTNKRIADELFVSLNTVKFHIKNIYDKLNVGSKNEAIDIFSKK